MRSRSDSEPNFPSVRNLQNGAPSRPAPRKTFDIACKRFPQMDVTLRYCNSYTACKITTDEPATKLPLDFVSEFHILRMKGNLTKDPRPAPDSSRTHRLRQTASGLFVILAFAIASWGVMRLHRGPRTLVAAPLVANSLGASGAGGITLPIADSLPAEPRLYAYSVIPGGVESAQELLAAARNDSVVAAHYSDFRANAARVITLDHNRAVYVSYRLGNRVFWTNRKIQIHQGETLLTDGTHQARTRCGNRVSEVPQFPVAPTQQPRLEALEAFPPAGPLSTSSPPLVGSLVPPASFSLPAPSPTLHEDSLPLFFPFVPGPGSPSHTVPTILLPGSGSSGPGSSGSSSGGSGSSGAPSAGSGGSGSSGAPGSPSVPSSPSGPGSGGSGSPGSPGTPTSPGTGSGSGSSGGPGSSGSGSPSAPGFPSAPIGPPITAPDPGTFVLLATGLAGLGLACKLRKRP